MAAPETFLQPDPRTVTSWTLQSIQAAETAANTGQISQAALLCDQIFADPRVLGCLSQRTSLVRMVPTFEEGRGPHATAAAEALADGDYWAMTPAAELRKLHRWGLVLGFGFGQMRWVDEAGNAYLRGGRNVPRLHTWHPQHAEWDGNKRKWYAYVGNGTRREEITAENGWVVYTPFGADAPWKEGLWRSLKVWWTLKQLAEQDWARHSEKHGIGAFVASAPDGATADTRTEFARQLRRLGREKGFALPVGWKLDLIEATADTYKTFVEQITLANTEMAIAIVGQNLTSEVSGGSYAAASIHSAVASTILGADGEALSDFEHDQIQTPYAVANWGDAEAAAWPVRDVSPPEEKAKPADVADLLAVIKTGGLQPTRDALVGLARDFGIETENAPGETLTQALQLAPTDAAKVVTVDEARTSQGLPPVGGELGKKFISDLGQADPEEPPAAPNPAAKAFALASGDVLAKDSGFVEGQLYTDQVADDSRDESGETLSDDITQLLGILDGAEDYESIRTKLLEHYEGMDSADLADIVHKALLLTELGGMYAVSKDSPKSAG